MGAGGSAPATRSTGALLINCAVPSARGGEPEPWLPVGGARATWSWGPGVAEGVLKSSGISLEPGSARGLSGVKHRRAPGVSVNDARGIIPRRRGHRREVSAKPGGQE